MAHNEVRRITPADVDRVVTLVRELADYEKSLPECQLTSEQLHTALFGRTPTVFAHVAEVDGDVVGTAIWFLNFSTWTGVSGIYLEDLFVRPAFRGRGLGKALLAALAKECVERGYARLQWSVLDWNTPSIEFYESIGAVGMDEWTVYRLHGQPLAELARQAGSQDLLS
jgi:GNAT superfamily N-acetyltransferase